jgi:DNA-binding response OmpR family regulator
LANKSLRILIAEDLPDTAQMLTTFLKLEGHSVRVAEDGEEAASMASLIRPDAVILDIGLPKLSGYEVAESIRAAAWGRCILIIAVSGYSEQSYIDAAHRSGMDHYLVKPADPAEIVRLLEPLTADVP